MSVHHAPPSHDDARPPIDTDSQRWTLREGAWFPDEQQHICRMPDDRRRLNGARMLSANATELHAKTLQHRYANLEIIERELLQGTD